MPIAILVLALLGAPLFVVIAAGALVGFHAADIPSVAVIIDLHKIATAPNLYPIPLFTFAGYVLAESKAASRIVNVSNAILGWLPGGLAIVTLAACAFFTAFTGASGVTIIALGGLLFPALMKGNYPERFNLGLITTGGSLGLLFPPSLPIIIYGFVAQVSISQMFVAGMLPGILLIIILSAYSFFVGHRAHVPRHAFSWAELRRALWDARYEIPLPFIILGGIYQGLLTINEAAAITAFYIFVVEVLLYRDIPFKQLPRVMRESMLLVGGIMIIIGCALGFTGWLIDEDVPQRILEAMRTYIDDQITFLIVLNIFLLIVGCLMDIFSALIVVVPLIVPIALDFGVDPVHLGIIFLTNLEIGYATPPVGINLFISSFRFRKPVVTLYRASLPFLGLLILALLIITYVPALSLGLVHYLGVE